MYPSPASESSSVLMYPYLSSTGSSPTSSSSAGSYYIPPTGPLRSTRSEPYVLRPKRGNKKY
jgi:hypothetical protein